MVTTRTLPVIRPGDRIAVISPAGRIKHSALNHGIQAIQDRGFQVVRGKNLLSKHRELAGDDSLRIHDLIWALRDPDIHAVFFARGGYGSSRLLPLLANRGLGTKPKLVAGFSDTTALQWTLWTTWQWPSLSGPLVAELGGTLTPESEETFWEIASGKSPARIGFGSPNVETVRPGEAHGTLMPGCLAIICTLIGTPFLPDMSNAILVIEDVGEAPFRIDRMLVHLKNAGIIDQIGGLVLGQFLDADACTDAISQQELKQRVTEILGDFTGPVVVGVPYGHRNNRWTLPIGIDVKLSTDPFGIEIVPNP
jgi:muramoyltetrapeptide carboxypeptidase